MRNFCNCPYKRPVKRGPVKRLTQARIQEILFLLSLPGMPMADFVLLERELVDGWPHEKA